MKGFDYVIKDEVGIHARPAGALAKKAKEYKSEITIKKGDREANATKLIAIMGLSIKCGDKITVSINGEDEKRALKELKEFFESNL